MRKKTGTLSLDAISAISKDADRIQASMPTYAELVLALRETLSSLEDMTTEDFSNGADRILRGHLNGIIARTKTVPVPNTK